MSSSVPSKVKPPPKELVNPTPLFNAPVADPTKLVTVVPDPGIASCAYLRLPRNTNPSSYYIWSSERSHIILID